MGGKLALIKTGLGIETLTGANTYTGGTTISFGRLQVGDGGTSGSLGSGSITDRASLIYDRSGQRDRGQHHRW